MPDFMRLPDMPDGTRCGWTIILPFSSSAPGTRALAASMLKAAQLAMFDAATRILLDDRR